MIIQINLIQILIQTPMVHTIQTAVKILTHLLPIKWHKIVFNFNNKFHSITDFNNNNNHYNKFKI
jgi:hypothetical protein